MIQKIVAGGQTGADRAGLDVAIRWGFPHGGWCRAHFSPENKSPSWHLKAFAR
jgi:hypothetical protein